MPPPAGRLSCCGAPGIPASRSPGRTGSAHRGCDRYRRQPARGGRHRHRQDLRLPGAGAARAAPGPDRDRYPPAAGPAVPARRRRGAQGAGRGCIGGDPQGPRQLRLPAAPEAQPRRRPLSRPRRTRQAAHHRAVRRDRYQTGDRAGCTELSEDDPVWMLATSTKDNCLGQDCPEVRQCPLMKARQKAQRADVLVVNHHLFCADLALKEDAIGDFLPRADIFIFDEAHQLPDIATDFFGDSVSTRQLVELSRDCLRAGLTDAAGRRRLARARGVAGDGGPAPAPGPARASGATGSRPAARPCAGPRRQPERGGAVGDRRA